MEMKFRVSGIVPICEGSEETDVRTEYITVDAHDFGMGQFKAEMEFRKLGPYHFPEWVKLVS
jgi:hypothetical protein